MENTITLDAMNIGTFFGALASPYSYTPALRARLNELYTAACRSDNRYFVLRGVDCIAAGKTEQGALNYMADDCVLVHVDMPNVTPEHIEQARRMWSYVPFRRCFVALKHGEEMQVILKPTAHYAGKLAREGWTVRELYRM